MRERIRIYIAACLYYSGLVRLGLWWRQRSGRHLIILNYHRAAGNLRAQLDYLRRHYRIMHLEDALQEFYGPDGQGKQGNDRRIPLVLTFDDGYQDNYSYAFPLVRTLQVPMTIFVIPGYVESGEYFWWLAAEKLVKSVKIDTVIFEGQTYHPAETEDRRSLTKAIDTCLRYATSVAEREERLAQIQQSLGVALPRRGYGNGDESSLPITWEQMREMEESGWVSFGAHTVHHPILAYLADATEAQREVTESRRLLEQKLGHPVATFAYPVGRDQHIGGQGVQAVQAAGFKWAVTTLEGENTRQTDPYLLNRAPGDIELHWLVMAAELVGLLGIVSRFRKKYEKFVGR